LILWTSNSMTAVISALLWAPRTLAGNDMIPEEFATSSRNSQLPKRRIGGREFLVVDQSANARANFSSAKKLVSVERINLGDDAIEALECLKVWWDRGFVERG
jgi:hypothetical protein